MAINPKLLQQALQYLASGGEIGVTGVGSENVGPNALLLNDDWWNGDNTISNLANANTAHTSPASTSASSPSQTASQIGQTASQIASAAGLAAKGANAVSGAISSTPTNPADSIPNGLQDVNPDSANSDAIVAGTPDDYNNPNSDISTSIAAGAAAADASQPSMSETAGSAPGTTVEAPATPSEDPNDPGNTIPNGLQDLNPDNIPNPGLDTASDPNSPESQSIAAAAGDSGSSGSLGSTLGTVSQGAGDVAGLAGAATGLASGTAQGEATGALNAVTTGAQISQQLGLASGAAANVASSINSLGKDGLAVIGLIQGIQQGGVSGDLQAAASAAKLASVVATAAGAQAVGQVLQELPGPIAAVAALYNFGAQWQSGATGSDALNGAEAGAAIGSMVVPGIGTLVGAVIGGAVGAISSVFGPGRETPENQVLTTITDDVAKSSNNNPSAGFAAAAGMTASQDYTLLAGASNARAGDMGSGLYSGVGGEAQFVKALGNTINSAIAKGQITSSTDSANVFSQVVQPWLKSQGLMQNLNEVDVHGNNEGYELLGAVYGLTNDYMRGTFTGNTDDYYGHQIGSQWIPAITGVNAASTTTTTRTTPVTPITSPIMGGRVQLAASGGEITNKYRDEPEEEYYADMNEIKDPRIAAMIEHLAKGGFVKKMSAKKAAPQEEEHGGNQHWKDVFGNMKRKGQYDPSFVRGSNTMQKPAAPPMSAPPAAQASPVAAPMQAPAAQPVAQPMQAHGVTYDMSNPKHAEAHQRIESFRKAGKSNPLFESDVQRSAGIQPASAPPMQAPAAPGGGQPQSIDDEINALRPGTNDYEKLSPEARKEFDKRIAERANRLNRAASTKKGTNTYFKQYRKRADGGEVNDSDSEQNFDSEYSEKPYSGSDTSFWASGNPALAGYANGGEVGDDSDPQNAAVDPSMGSTTQAVSADGSQTTPDDIPNTAYLYGVIKALQAAGQPTQNATQIAQRLLSTGQSRKDILASIQKNPSEVTSMVQDQDTPAVNPTQQQSAQQTLNTNFQRDYDAATSDPRFKSMQSPSGQAASQGMAHLQGLTPSPESMKPENNPLLAPVLNRYATEQKMLENQNAARTSDLEATGKSVANQQAQQQSLREGMTTAKNAQELQNQTAANDPNSAQSQASRASIANLLTQAGMPADKVAAFMKMAAGMNATQLDAIVKQTIANYTSTAGIGQTRAATAQTQAATTGQNLTNEQSRRELSFMPQGAQPTPSSGVKNAAPPAAPGGIPPQAGVTPQKPSVAQLAGFNKDGQDIPSNIAGKVPGPQAAQQKTNTDLADNYNASDGLRANMEQVLAEMQDLVMNSRVNILTRNIPEGLRNAFSDKLKLFDKLKAQYVNAMGGGGGTATSQNFAAGALPELGDLVDRDTALAAIRNLRASLAKDDLGHEVTRDLASSGSLHNYDDGKMKRGTATFEVTDRNGHIVPTFGNRGVLAVPQKAINSHYMSSLEAWAKKNGYTLNGLDNYSNAVRLQALRNGTTKQQ